MKQLFLFFLFLGFSATPVFSQNKLVTLGSSTTAGVGTTSPDSAWVQRVNRFYKYSIGVLDSAYNLGVSATTVYRAMPTSYVPPASRPTPDTTKNVTKANALLSLTTTNGVVIVNFPSNGYDNYSVAEILSSLQTIYDSVTAAGHSCLLTTTQPRSDGAFALSSTKLKLAVLKDSIINRFGVARTLNFWDGMYNPADTTILPAYAAGDNVHFNNAGHRELAGRVIAKNIFALSTPAAGDYRSNVNPTGIWSNPATWQVYNGTTWIAASTPPDSTSGAIKIVAGDSIRVDAPTSLDEVQVDSGGVLTFFNISTPVTYTLANGAGEDLVVYGRLYVSVGATLTGTGTVYNTPTGQLILRNQGVLNATTLNEGTTRISGTGNILARAFTNNGTFLLVDFTLNLNNGATLINNDSVAILFNSNAFFASTSGTGTFINAPGAVLHKTTALGITYVNSTVTFNNAGTVKGIGQFIFQNVGSNTGNISPGNSPGTVTVNPGFISSKTPALRLEIAVTGALAGTTYDQLQISTVSTTITNISGTRLYLIDAGADPVGTVYTLVSSAGTLTGTFALVDVPFNFGNLTYNTSTITIQKTAPTPLDLELLYFRVWAEGGQAQLSWHLKEKNNLINFIVERSSDGRQYSTLGTVPAQDKANAYRFTDSQPNSSTVFYRLKMQTLDGRVSYSAVQVLRFGTAENETVQLWPNPAKEALYLKIPDDGPAVIGIVDAQGLVQKQWNLPAGTHLLSLEGLAAGIYGLTLQQKGKPVYLQRFMRL